MLNLLRCVQSKQENTILAAHIQGPNEPQHDFNTILQPLVDDLLKLWDGVELNVAAVRCRKKIRSALVCVACYLPAGRKVCGFWGIMHNRVVHNATKSSLEQLANELFWP